MHGIDQIFSSIKCERNYQKKGLYFFYGLTVNHMLKCCQTYIIHLFIVHYGTYKKARIYLTAY